MKPKKSGCFLFVNFILVATNTEFRNWNRLFCIRLNACVDCRTARWLIYADLHFVLQIRFYLVVRNHVLFYFFVHYMVNYNFVLFHCSLLKTLPLDRESQPRHLLDDSVLEDNGLHNLYSKIRINKWVRRFLFISFSFSFFLMIVDVYPVSYSSKFV